MWIAGKRAHWQIENDISDPISILNFERLVRTSLKPYALEPVVVLWGWVFIMSKVPL